MEGTHIVRVNEVKVRLTNIKSNDLLSLSLSPLGVGVGVVDVEGLSRDICIFSTACTPSSASSYVIERDCSTLPNILLQTGES
jgi:hypothetical protein